MSVSVEKLENSMVKLTVTVSAEDFEKALDQAYRKQKSKLRAPGFRKGHVTRQVAEHLYGPAIFYDDAANIAVNGSYADALRDCGEEVTSDPTFGVVQIGEGKDFIYTAVVAVKPPVELGTYRGVEIDKIDEKPVTDEDVEKELKRQQDANAKIVDVTDRPVKDGDLIRLDYEGSIDGVPFDGGKAEDAALTIGSHSFIPGFEEQLVGANIGEEKNITVTFPENYQAENLRGKEAVFKCKVNSIREKVLPELNDDFADEVSEFSTLDEYKADIRKNLEAQHENEVRRQRENAALNKVVNEAKIDIPEPMLRFQEDRILESYAENLRYQGISLEQYEKAAGVTEDQMRESVRPQADRNLRTSLVLEAVADAEGFEVTDEDMDAELQKIAEENRLPLDTVKKYYETDDAKDSLRENIKVQRAAELIGDSAVEVEKKEENASGDATSVDEASSDAAPAEEASEAAPAEETKTE